MTKDCPCPPPFKDVAYCDDCPYRRPVETGGVLPNGKAGVILKHAADTR